MVAVSAILTSVFDYPMSSFTCGAGKAGLGLIGGEVFKLNLVARHTVEGSLSLALIPCSKGGLPVIFWKSYTLLVYN